MILSKGAPITVISKRLGHADLTITLNAYSNHVIEEVYEDVMLLKSKKKEYNELYSEKYT